MTPDPAPIPYRVVVGGASTIAVADSPGKAVEMAETLPLPEFQGDHFHVIPEAIFKAHAIKVKRRALDRMTVAGPPATDDPTKAFVAELAAVMKAEMEAELESELTEEIALREEMAP